MKARLLFALFMLLQSGIALGHARGEDYVFARFQENSIEGEFQINVEDLSQKLGIDMPAGAAERQQVVLNTADTVHDYIRQQFSISPLEGIPYEITFEGAEVFQELTDYAQYRFTIAVDEMPDQLVISHHMLYENDSTHRGLFLVQYVAKTDTEYGEEHTALVFSPGNHEQVLNLKAVPGLIERSEMIRQGMLHIWIGIDHLLFLLALILPTVLSRSDGGWAPVPRPGPALRRLLAIVTVFTLAHSVTLLLAALDIIQVNSRLVESVIALSIILVALNNIFTRIDRGSLWVILGLGMFHGLGFASVMGNLPFRMGDLVKMVIRFNIGVELGQIVIVMSIFPLLYFSRNQWFYQPVLLKGVSWVLAGIAAVWLVQRAFG